MLWAPAPATACSIPKPRTDARLSEDLIRRPAPRSSVDHLGTLGAPLGLRVGEGLAAFCEAFDSHLRHFAEIGVQLEPAGLAAVTLGHGADFAREVCAFMEGRGFAPAQMDTVPRLQRAIDDWMLVRALESAAHGLELGLYFRKSMSLLWAQQWLDDQGEAPGERAALEQLARLVGSGRTGIVAARLERDQPTLYKVYLHAGRSGDPEAARALARVFAYFQLPSERWSPFVEGLGSMDTPPSDLYLSLLLGDGDAFDSLKLDMFQVDLGALQVLMEESGLLSPAGPTPAELGRSLGMDHAEHFGVRFHQRGAGLTVYFVPESER